MNKTDLNLFNELTKELIEDEKNHPVVSPISINDVFDKLNLELDIDPCNEQAFTQALRSLVMNTPRTATKKFFNQLFGGRNSKSTLGELLSVILNNSMYTYKVGGPMIAIEQVIIKSIIKLAGYNEEAHGTISTGGSMANYMALIMARDHHDKEIKLNGVKNNLTIYTSDQSHYSINKNASFAGIGRSNVRYIKTNDAGEMRVDELEKQILSDIDKGYQPVFINATIGTTVLGAIDSLEEISDIGSRFKIWVHADAAFYGSMLFSEKYRDLLKGLHLTDSFCMNAHKLLSTPISCSLIFTKHKSCLYYSFISEANYLFQGESDDWNPGKISFQCGRRNDALKLWTLWKSVGTSGLGEMIDQEFYLADLAREYIRSNDNYTLHNFDNALTICFNYKNIPAEQLCEKLYEDAQIMVGYGQFKDVRFIRLVSVNSSNQKEDVLEFFERLEACADKYF